MNNEIQTISGPLDISSDGRFAFVRCGKPQKELEGKNEKGNLCLWHAADEDVYVSEHQLEDLKVKENDVIECTVRPPVGNERFSSAVEILKINGRPV